MPNWIHRTNKRFLKSVPSAELPEPVGNYIQDPDLSTVVGLPQKYWLINGDVVSLADPAQQDAIDQALVAAALDVEAEEINNTRSLMRAVALEFLDQFNDRSDAFHALLDAIINANNLSDLKSTAAGITRPPQGVTPAQLRTAVRNRMG